MILESKIKCAATDAANPNPETNIKAEPTRGFSNIASPAPNIPKKLRKSAEPWETMTIERYAFDSTSGLSEAKYHGSK